MVEKYKVFSGLFFGAMWALLCFGFVAEELIPPLASAKSAVYLLCDFVFLVCGLYTLRNRRDIIVFGSFVVLGVVSACLNHLGFVFTVNGARDFFGLLFAAPIIRFMLTSRHRERFIESFDKQLYIFLWIQAFCMTEQFLRYGANDHGGGSMGYGFSGIASTSIYIISFYLISKKWKFGNYWGELAKNKVYVFLLYPTFLNETKISFLFLLAYFLLLLKFEWKTVFKLLVSTPMIIVGMIGAGVAYLGITGQAMEAVFSEDAMEAYMVGEDPEGLMEVAELIQDEVYTIEDMGGVVDIPRFTKIVFVPEALSYSSGGILFGAGLGQFKGGTVIEMSKFASEWQWLLSGSLPLSFSILIQLGIVGFVWFVFNIVTLMAPRSASLLGINIKCFIWIIILLILLYNDSLRFFPFTFILFYIAMRGYVFSSGSDGESVKNV